MQHAIGRLFQSAQLFHSNNASVGVARRSLEVYNPGVHQLILDDSALSSTGTLPTNRPGIPGRWPILIVPELKSNVEVDLPKQLLLYVSTFILFILF